MADLEPLKEMVETTISQAENIIADVEAERSVLIRNKLALDTALSDVVAFNIQLSSVEMGEGNRAGYQDARRLMAGYRVQIGTALFTLEERIVVPNNQNLNPPAPGAASTSDITNAFRNTAKAPAIV